MVHIYNHSTDYLHVISPYFRTKATQNIKYESYIENDMLRVHTEANHSVMTFMGPICLWIGGE